MTPKAEKDALWKDLKLQWSFLKRDSGADEVKKGEAKKRINEIQDSLKLEKTKIQLDKIYHMNMKQYLHQL